jgi:hypothetical protein
MTTYDIFNGDADGLCALHQLRLAEPRPEAQLITGVKRDIKLLSRLRGQAASGDEITVLDISMSSNIADLKELLAAGCRVFYADHHFSGDIPDNPTLTAHIDPAPEVCTSLIIDRLLAGRYRPWAVAAAFGDNLHDAARAAASELNLSVDKLAVLRELGELLNYNGYGAAITDLHFHPAELFAAMQPFADPFDFCRESPQLATLRDGFRTDMENARSRKAVDENKAGRIYRFPAEPWSKRAAGVFINERARERPDLAHALLVDNGDETLMVSVRAPLDNKQGADKLCLAFPTGGGRQAAAGINALPSNDIEQFTKKFIETFAYDRGRTA